MSLESLFTTPHKLVGGPLLEILYFGATFALSCGLGLYLTPRMRDAAIRFGVLDRPDENLKKHSKATPYLGGIAIYLAFIISVGIVFDFQRKPLGLLLGATMVTMLGLFDDLKALDARVKLFGQFLAGWILIKSGIAIKLASLPPPIAIALTLLWIVGITNALNIIDVSDGLATGVGAISALGLFLLAIINQDLLIATTTLALVGALVGFLRFNKPVAEIYLGDTGSLFIGFMLAALSMIGQYTQNNVVAAFVPLIFLFVPLFDIVLVSLARLSKGISPMRGSPDHFAVRLRHRGWSARRIAYGAYGVTLVTVCSGIAVVLSGRTVAVALLSANAALFIGLLGWFYLACPAPAPAEQSS